MTAAVTERPAPAKFKHTEATVLCALQARHSGGGGNGPEWAFIEHVRNAAGFDATRTADAMALHLWPSRGHELHGFEVKVSRSDWRRELADPSKADGWFDYVDRWWIAAPKGVVPPDELPTSWGLLEVGDDGTGIRVKVQAPPLRDKGAPRPTITLGLLACMLRAAGAGLTGTVDAKALAEAEDRGYRKARDYARSDPHNWEALYRQQAQRLMSAERNLRELKEIVGARDIYCREEQLAAALKVVLDGDRVVAQQQDRIARMVSELESVAAHLRQQFTTGAST